MSFYRVVGGRLQIFTGIVDPKELNVYGAPCVWAVFTGTSLIEGETYHQEEPEL